MTALHTLLHFTWCLPQTLLGLIIRGCGYEAKDEYQQSTFFAVKWLKSSLFSLGRYIFTPDRVIGVTEKDYKILLHELGHSKQSLILGWLYLPVIAIPSVCWFWCHRWFHIKRSYYWFFTERWANRLAGIDLS